MCDQSLPGSGLGLSRGTPAHSCPAFSMTQSLHIAGPACLPACQPCVFPASALAAKGTLPDRRTTIFQHDASAPRARWEPGRAQGDTVLLVYLTVGAFSKGSQGKSGTGRQPAGVLLQAGVWNSAHVQVSKHTHQPARRYQQVKIGWPASACCVLLIGGRGTVRCGAAPSRHRVACSATSLLWRPPAGCVAALR